MTSTASIPFIDLGAQRRRLGERIDKALLSVVDEGNFILGPQVRQLEEELATYCGAQHAITCANGTDAIGLPLMALGLKPGQAVICPSFTFASTAEVVAWLGAVPVFADVLPDTFNLDPEGLAVALRTAREEGLEVRGVIAVDLFGQPADYDPIEAFCEQNGLFLISDSAQGFGSVYKGRRSGTIGKVATTSFFPAKPLGCYGDGGALFTDDEEIAATIRSLHVHGKGSDKYDNIRIGMNSRLDTVQAAILLEKLAIYDEEIDARQSVADRYREGLGDRAVTPVVMEDCLSVWAQYVIRVEPGRRDFLQAHLKDKGIPTAIYYPRPLHQQTAYRDFPVAGGKLEVSDRIAGEVLALPMHPYLEENDQARIVEATRNGLSANR